MKKLQLTDRVVVEIKKEFLTCVAPSFISDTLRDVANQIEDGYMGGKERDIIATGEKYELLWDRECVDKGGLRLGDKSIIEEKSATISDELINRIREFNKDYNESYDEI